MTKEANLSVSNFKCGCGQYMDQGARFCPDCSELNLPIATLSNGLRVVNLSSPYPYNFTDGTILPGCTVAQANRTDIYYVENETVSAVSMRVIYHMDNTKPLTSEQHKAVMDGSAEFLVKDVELVWKIPPGLRHDLERLSHRMDYDILLVSAPILVAMKTAGMEIGRARVVRLTDGFPKQARIDRFCI